MTTVLRAGLALPIALLVAALVVTVTFSAGVGRAPDAFFGEGAIVLAPAGGEAPGRAGVPLALVGALRGLPEVRAVSPEVLLITSHGGRSLFARGVELDAFLALEGGALTRGRAFAGAGEAVAGEGMLRAFGLDVGARLLVASPFERAAEPVTIVGAFDAPGPARDEVLLPLDVARGLAPLGADEAHLVRIDATDPARVDELLSSVAPVFTYANVRVDAPDALPGAPMTLRADLTNWGQGPGIEAAELRSGGALVASRTFVVPGRATVPIEIPFTLASPGASELTINPTISVEVRPAALRVELPDVVVAGRDVTLRVLDAGGAPVAGADITLAGARATTDADGWATAAPLDTGPAWARAARGDDVGLARTFVVRPDEEALVVAEAVALEPPGDLLGETSEVALAVEWMNRGGRVGPTAVRVLVDGAEAARLEATLRPGERAREVVRLAPLAAGVHEVRLDAEDAPALALRVYEGDDPHVAALLEAFARRAEIGAQEPTRAERAGEYVERLLGNVRVAVVALSLASGALVALGAVAVLSRHVAERAPVLGALKALGATDERVATMALRDGLRIGAVAALLGLALGLALVVALDALGAVRAFGHAVRPAFGARALALVALSATLLVALVARALVAAALRRSVDDLLQGRVLRPAGRRARA